MHNSAGGWGVTKWRSFIYDGKGGVFLDRKGTLLRFGFVGDFRGEFIYDVFFGI